MKRLTTFLCTILFGMLLIAQTEVNPNAAEFRFDNERHDFGELDEGPKATHEFSFTNVGKEPLIITNARASCGCTVPKWPKNLFYRVNRVQLKLNIILKVDQIALIKQLQ